MQRECTAAIDFAREFLGWSAEQRAIQARDVNLMSEVRPDEGIERQEREGFRAFGRSDLNPWPLRLPLDWEANPFGDSNWMFQLHAWRAIDPYILAFEADADPERMSWPVEMVMDWSRFHLLQGRHTRFSWYDMAVGIRAMKVAYLLDGSLRGRWPSTPERRDRLAWLWHAHLVALTDPSEFALNNHGLFQLHGLLALVAVLPAFSRAEAVHTYVDDRLRALLDHQFTTDGAHRENSPAYHFFALTLLNRFQRTGWYERHPYLLWVREERTWSRNAEIYRSLYESVLS